jgi:hypothetical protein
MPSSSAQEFELHDDTMAAATLEMHPVTMRFTTPAAEQDFLRFRSAGRVAIVIATFVISVPTYVGIYWQTGLVAVAVAFAINLAALALEVAVVACSTPVTVEGQVKRATRHERISAVGYWLSAIAWQTSASAVARANCGHSDTRNEFRRCVSQFEVALTLSIMTVLMAPRLTYVVPVNCAITATYLFGVALSYLHFEPIDYVADGAVAVGYMVALNIAAWTKEARERTFFLVIVTLQQANAAIDKQREATRVVLAAALPAPLLNDGALSATRVSHHSTHATVAVTDIHSFSAWTTWHLEVDVVHILHALMAAYDKVVEDHCGVERAMTYGDSYVVCSGLLEPHREHADAVMQCAIELRTAARSVSGMLEFSQFSTRTSIFTGELRGTSIGSVSRRYAVMGPAFDSAVDRIGLCDRGNIEVGAFDVPESAVRDGTGDSRSTRSECSVIEAPSKGASTAGGPDFSPLWLAFPQDVDAPELPAVLVAEAIVPCVVITAFLLTIIVEHASPDPQRHHSNQPLGLGLLFAGFATAWVNVGALVVSQGKLPVAAATALKVVPPALTGYGLVLLQCYFAQARSGFVITLGFLCRFDIAVPWLLQLFFVFVSTVVPAIIFTAQLDGGDVVQSIQTFVVIPIALVVHRYFTVRADCEHVVASDVAADNVVRAGEQARALDTLLAGLLPPHMLLSFAPVAGAARTGPRQVQPWPSLSVLQVRLHGCGHDVQDAWECVGRTVSKTGGKLLELVQASGDTLLVGGPFVVGADEAQHVAAARQVLVFLHELAASLDSAICTFTAVATSGTAYGALLGAGNVTYRVFGAAVRENDAMMAAAPRPIGRPRNIAFASESFRRQERNFSLQNPSTLVEAAMSTALAVSRSSNGFLDSSTTAADGRAAKPFGAVMLWRAVGLGTASVAVVNM